MTLPAPDPDALDHSDRLRGLIAGEIRTLGWIPFRRYMELALYAPSLGYYAGGARKFGRGGDFVTAPELTPLFARALAAQIVEIMQSSAPAILEFGAGSGALAVELLAELDRRGQLPTRYGILEVSPDLRERQRARLAQLDPRCAARVEWLDALPERFSGCVLANEVLDAMPVDLLTWSTEGMLERGVALNAGGDFEWQDRLAPPDLVSATGRLAPPAPYTSELQRTARAWISSWAARLEAGALLLVDYGFPAAEYYHPQRSSGTLMCHYRHHAHGDPFYLPGLCDITAHVDFSAIAEAGLDAGLTLLGYTGQAQFLMNCGLLDTLGQVAEPGSARYARATAAVQKLLSPAEMGELFKVIALGRGLAQPLLGFARGDRRHTLG
jgi:SAM-dependent MidA family methyltransferase